MKNSLQLLKDGSDLNIINMESQVIKPETKEWQIGVLRNIENNMSKSERKCTTNWVIVKNYFMQHTSHGGRTTSYKHCLFLEIDPDGFTFY